MISFAYVATLSAFYFGREIFGPANDLAYIEYILTWIPIDYTAPYCLFFIVVIVVPSISGLLAMAYYFHRASLSDGDFKIFALLITGLVFGVFLSLLGAGLAFLALGGGGYFVITIIFAGMASASVPIAAASITLFLILIRCVIRVVRYILLQIFDVASSPSVSPFTYATSILGVIILAAKVVQVAAGF